jgi:hypothetical protein
MDADTWVYPPETFSARLIGACVCGAAPYAGTGFAGGLRSVASKAPWFEIHDGVPQYPEATPAPRAGS